MSEDFGMGILFMWIKIALSLAALIIVVLTCLLIWKW